MGLDGNGRVELEKLAALGLGTRDLLVLGRHVGDAAAVNDGDLLGAHANGGACHVHGHVAAANYADALVREVRADLITQGTQHLDGGKHTHRVLPGKAQLAVQVRTNG